MQKIFPKGIDKMKKLCYNLAVARMSAEALGTLMITVSDLRRSREPMTETAERGNIHRGVLAIPEHKKAGRLLNITESMRVRRSISRLYYSYAVSGFLFCKKGGNCEQKEKEEVERKKETEKYA